MFHPSFRIVLALAALSFGIIEIARGRPYGAILVVSAGAFAYMHVRYGAVRFAFLAYKKGDLPAVEQRLGSVWFPNSLNAESRTYYDFLRGVVALGKGNVDDAKRALEAAARGPLRSDNMRCVVLCHLAGAAVAAGDIEGARGHVAEARSLRHSDNVEKTLKSIEAKIDAPDDEAGEVAPAEQAV